MSRPDSYSIQMPYRRKGMFLRATDERLRPPIGYASVPGYDELILDVRTGRIPPFWGDAYTLTGGPPADIVMTTTMQDAVSDALRDLFERAGVKGIHYYPIRVNNGPPMHIIGVEGTALFDASTRTFVLEEGQEIGLYKQATLYVSPRVGELVIESGLDVSVEPGVPGLGSCL